MSPRAIEAAERTSDGQHRELLALRAEIEALSTAAREQERLVLKGYKQLDDMLQAVEAQRNALQGANANLERAQAHLDRIIDTMEEVLIVIGVRGEIELVNVRLLDLTGYSRDELVGADPSLLFVPRELDELAGPDAAADEPLRGMALLRLMSRLRDEQLDGHLVTRHGATIAHLFRWSILYSSKGKKEGVVIVGADVRRLHFTLDALERAHAEMRLILNHVNQGLLTLHLDGTLGEGRSAKVEAWFGELRSGMRFWEFLGRHDAQFGDHFQLGWDAVVEGVLPVELSLEQLPRRIKIRSSTYEVDCSPMYDAGRLSGAFVVLTDITEPLRQAEERRLKAEFLDVLDHINRDRQGVLEFYREVGAMVQQVLSAGRGQPRDGLEGTMRLLHTIKGNAAMFDVKSLEMVCHTLEQQLQDSGACLDSAQRNALAHVWEHLAVQIDKVLGEGAGGPNMDAADHARLLQMVAADRPKEELLREVKRLALEPTHQRLSRLGLQAQALARRVGKGPINVRVEAGLERFPAGPWAAFWAAFTHAIRNAVDHGVESPQEREAAGKDETACITFRSFRHGDRIVVEIADDGRGIDWAQVRARAERMGLDARSQHELEQLLLSDGFSTREQASLLSGRGVGMGALNAACVALGGTIGFNSVLGQGTTLRCELPYSLVI